MTLPIINRTDSSSPMPHTHRMNPPVLPKGPAFQQVLEETLHTENVKYSAHAQHRLAARGITLSENQMERLQNATEQAADKGARDTLILMDNLAFVVSVTNRTVITAMERDQMKEAVFTNIDSAVLDA